MCFKRLESPVHCCSNGHAICNICKPGVGSYCPTCRNTFTGYQNTLLNNLLEIFPFNCKFADEGCDERSKPEELKKHEEICDYRTIKCLLQKNGQLCSDEISLPKYTNHIETFHDSYVHRVFTLGTEFTTVLPKKSQLEKDNCHYRVLKDGIHKLFFLEMTHYNDNMKWYQISVHLIGKQADSSNYIYTIDAVKNDIIKGFKFSNECLPNVMKPDEALKFHPFILFDQNEEFSQTIELKYHLKIEKKEDFENTSPKEVHNENKGSGDSSSFISPITA